MVSLKSIKPWQHANWGKIGKISFKQDSAISLSEQPAAGTSATKLALVPAISEQVTVAKLLWMLKVAKNDFSFASCEGLVIYSKRCFQPQL